MVHAGGPSRCESLVTLGKLGTPFPSSEMVEAEGFGILRLSDNKTQVIDFIKREKRQKHRMRRSRVHGGYTGFRAMRR